MDTITTQEELEEVLLDESISYPRCFTSLEGVRKDIQDSLSSPTTSNTTSLESPQGATSTMKDPNSSSEEVDLGRRGGIES